MLNRPEYHLPIEQNPVLILALGVVRRALLDTKLASPRHDGLRDDAFEFLQSFVPEMDPAELPRLYHSL